MKKYSHALDIGFTLNSDSIDTPSNNEIIEALERRIKLLKENPDEIIQAVGIYDTVENY